MFYIFSDTESEASSGTDIDDVEPIGENLVSTIHSMHVLGRMQWNVIVNDNDNLDLLDRCFKCD